MSSFSPLLSSLLKLIVGGTLAAMLLAWIWLGLQLQKRRRLLGPPVTRHVPWGVKSVVGLVLGWVALNLLVVSVYAAVTHRQHRAPLAFAEQMFLVTVVNGAALVVLPLSLRAFSGAKPADLGLDLKGGRHSARVGAVAFLIVTWPVNIIHVLCASVWKPQKHPLEEMVRGGLNFGVAYLAVLSAVVLAPAVEEFLFRGVVQSWLTSLFQRWAAAKATASEVWLEELPPEDVPAAESSIEPSWTTYLPIVLTSAVFAIAHSAQWPAPIPIFVLSLALGTIYQRTGSLIASFVLHALFNGFSTLLLFWALTFDGGKAAKDVPPPQSSVSATAHADFKGIRDCPSSRGVNEFRYRDVFLIGAQGWSCYSSGSPQLSRIGPSTRVPTQPLRFPSRGG